MDTRQISLRTILGLVAISAMTVSLYLILFPKPAPVFTPEGYLLDSMASTPPCSIYWFSNENGNIVSGFAAFGETRPQIMVSHNDGTIRIPSLQSPKIKIPRDGYLYILGPELEIHRTNAKMKSIASAWQNYAIWAKQLSSEIEQNEWP